VDEETGELLDPNLFKVIEPRIYVMDDGDLFHIVGHEIHTCRAEANTTQQMNICETMPPFYFYDEARCDTTRELAELAYQAGEAGHHSGFRSPRSHFELRTIVQDIGFVEQNENGKHSHMAPCMANCVFPSYPKIAHSPLPRLFSRSFRRLAVPSCHDLVSSYRLSCRSLQGS
jgi:hypothetical protein